jgi:4-hydroxy-tetrahydrodipicolinate synthase
MLHATPPIARLSGYVTAVPTPFHDDGIHGDAIDEQRFARFCDGQIRQGVAGLVVCGTTGEAPTLSPAEQDRLVRLAVEVAHHRVPVIAGAGAASTSHAIDLARAAEREGADGLLIVTPYYVRPSQEGLYRHFAAIHDATGLPILLYDVPARTCSGLEIETIARLAALPRIVGLKDATGDLARPARLRRLLGNDFRLMTGDDATALGFFAEGGNGCISVTSNVAPKLCSQMYDAWARGDGAESCMLSALLVKLTRALFAESNPVPVKYALELMGHMSAAVRLPLTAPAEPTRALVADAVAKLGMGCVRPRYRLAS